MSKVPRHGKRRSWGIGKVLWRLWLPYLRVAGFILCVAAAFIVYELHSARAQLDERMLEVGEHLMRYDEARRQDEPRGVVLNGERLWFSSGTTDHSVPTVLDYFEHRCSERDGKTARQIFDVAGIEELPDGPAGDLLDPTMREGTEDRGYVACIDTGTEEPLRPGEVLDRVRAFNETGDLAEIGELRYVYARKGRSHTHMMAFWTQGSFMLKKMFPEKGDAPGSDVAGVPRPPDSRRIMSSYEEGHPYSATIYTGSSMGKKALERHYRELLPDEGWDFVDPAEPVAHKYETEDPTIVAESDGRTLILVLAEDAQGGAATVLSTH